MLPDCPAGFLGASTGAMLASSGLSSSSPTTSWSSNEGSEAFLDAERPIKSQYWLLRREKISRVCKRMDTKDTVKDDGWRKVLQGRRTVRWAAVSRSLERFLNGRLIVDGSHTHFRLIKPLLHLRPQRNALLTSILISCAA